MKRPVGDVVGKSRQRGAPVPQRLEVFKARLRSYRLSRLGDRRHSPQTAEGTHEERNNRNAGEHKRNASGPLLIHSGTSGAESKRHEESVLGLTEPKMELQECGAAGHHGYRNGTDKYEHLRGALSHEEGSSEDDPRREKDDRAV